MDVSILDVNTTYCTTDPTEYFYFHCHEMALIVLVFRPTFGTTEGDSLNDVAVDFGFEISVEASFAKQLLVVERYFSVLHSWT